MHFGRQDSVFLHYILVIFCTDFTVAVFSLFIQKGYLFYIVGTDSLFLYLYFCGKLQYSR